ncbi:MAG: GNAT family N-acetyltransferase [Bordetella sp.]|nr:GNAT family N-acetyltransferase [Bordetella sp.]
MTAGAPKIHIETVHDITPEIVAAFNRLLPQLSATAPRPSPEQLAQLVAAPANTVFVARSAATTEIVGTLTLIEMRMPTGVRAWVEDVVVDAAARGLGAGDALVQAALARARALGARSVDLTSSPSRVAAHRLYERTGFATRDTHVFRHSFE